MRIHNGSRLESLGNDLKHEGVEGYFLVSRAVLIELFVFLEEFGNIRLIHICNVRDVLP